jgi:hypothetical protein
MIVVSIASNNVKPLRWDFRYVITYDIQFNMVKVKRFVDVVRWGEVLDELWDPDAKLWSPCAVVSSVLARNPTYRARGALNGFFMSTFGMTMLAFMKSRYLTN